MGVHRTTLSNFMFVYRKGEYRRAGKFLLPSLTPKQIASRLEWAYKNEDEDDMNSVHIDEKVSR